MIQSVREYFEDQRKEVDEYTEGEHKWLGDVDQSTTMASLSMYPSSLPWYHSRE